MSATKGLNLNRGHNTILIVDDEAFVLAATSRILQNAGFVVYTCELWGKVAGMIRKTLPDLVLLDYNMPSLKGDDLCQILKQNSPKDDLKVVMFSAEDSEVLARVTLKCGADGYIRKNATPDRLIKEVRTFLPQPVEAMAAPTRLGSVLAVDDSPVFRSMYKKALTNKYECKIIEAKDGLEGLEQLDRDRIDLILLDVNMPRMNGLQLLETITETNRRMPTVIMTSTEGKDSDVLRAIKLGARAYLIKPFTPEALYTMIDSVVGNAS